jgi:hypothetical protein
MESGLEQPEVEFILVADKAEVVNGKLYMIGGGFDQIGIGNFEEPAVFSLAIGLTIPWHFANLRIPLNVVMAHEDGAEVATINIQIVSGRPPNSIAGQDFRTMIAFEGKWPLPDAATYGVTARFGETSMKKIRFHVLQTP